MRFFLVGQLLVLALTASAATVRVSQEWGFDPADATAFLQVALGSAHPHDVVIIDGAPGTVWYTDPLFLLRDNFTLLLEPGVTLAARPGQFNDPQACLLTLSNRSGVTISGYEAVFKMQKSEYAALADSEYRHAIRLNGVAGVTIEGLEIRDSGGDGIYVGPSYSGTFGVAPSTPSTSVRIKNCLIDNNYRQGISVTDAIGLVIEHCSIKNTSGTLPQSGIDFEPFREHQRLVGCVVRHCSITDNAGRGLQNGMGDLRSSSLPVDIRYEDCYIARNGTGGLPADGAAITVETNDDGVTGQIVFERCLVEDEPYNGLYVRKDAADVAVGLIDCVFRRTGTDVAAAYNNPVVIELRDYNNPQIPFGGVDFDEVLVDDSVNRPHLVAVGFFGAPYPILKDVTGRIFVINPHVGTPGSQVSQFLGGANGGANQNVTIAQTPTAGWAGTNLSMTASDPLLTEGTTDPGMFTVSRDGAPDVAFPLPVYFTESGTATNRIDLDYLPPVQIIAAGEVAADRELVARADDLIEPAEIYVLTLVDDAAYNPFIFASAAVTIAASAALPLRWERVWLTDEECRRTLHWTTTEEYGVDRFEVEFYLEGSWKTVGQLSAYNRAANAYAFSISEPIPSGYLRLRQIDYDGRFSYSPVVNLTTACPAEGISVRPNPTTGTVYLDGVGPHSQIAVYSTTGGLVLQTKGTQALDLRGLPSAVYWLEIRENGQISRERLILQR